MNMKGKIINKRSASSFLFIFCLLMLNFGIVCADSESDADFVSKMGSSPQQMENIFHWETMRILLQIWDIQQ